MCCRSNCQHLPGLLHILHMIRRTFSDLQHHHPLTRKNRTLRYINGSLCREINVNLAYEPCVPSARILKVHLRVSRPREDMLLVKEDMSCFANINLKIQGIRYSSCTIWCSIISSAEPDRPALLHTMIYGETCFRLILLPAPASIKAPQSS